MSVKRLHILSLLLLTALLSASPLRAQETLKASRIEAKGARRYLPSLGLPRSAEGVEQERDWDMEEDYREMGY